MFIALAICLRYRRMSSGVRGSIKWMSTPRAIKLTTFLLCGSESPAR